MIYDFEADSWYIPKSFTIVPPPRWAHSSVVLDGTMYVFGGVKYSLACVEYSTLARAVAYADTWVYTQPPDCSVPGTWQQVNLASPGPQLYLPAAAAFTDGRIYVAGGFHSPAGASYLEVSQKIWIFEPSSATWTSSLPSAFSKLPALSSGQDLKQVTVPVANGGDQQDVLAILTETMWFLDPVSMTWTESRSPVPEPIAMATAVSLALDSVNYPVVVLFGGFQPGFRAQDAMWIATSWNPNRFILSDRPLWFKSTLFDPLTYTTPSPRYGHTLTLTGQYNVPTLFGGATSQFSQVFNDVWQVVPESQEPAWVLVNTTNPPTGRWGHCAAGMGDSHMLVAFGAGKQVVGLSLTVPPVYDDSWVLDLVTFVWEKVPQRAIQPQSRLGCACAPLSVGGDDLVAMYGGVAAHKSSATKGSVSNAFDPADDGTWLFRVSTMAWEPIPEARDHAPSLRSFFTMLRVGLSSVVIHGGAGGVLDSTLTTSGQNLLADTWQLTCSPSGSCLWTELITRGAIGISLHTAYMRPGPLAIMEVFGGLRAHRGALGGVSASLSNEIHGVMLGCNAGYFSPDFGTVPCSPCPLGTFQNLPGSKTCAACSGLTYTAAEGADEASDCSVCQPDACSHNGRCRVVFGTTTCDCNLGYRGQRCQTNWVGPMMGGLLGGTAFVLLALVAFRFYRGRKKLQAYSVLQEQLLEQSQFELSELERAFEIDAADVHLGAVIGEGASGIVYLSEWHEIQVAVKKLRNATADFSDELSAQEFESEIRLQRTLRHRNVALFYGAGCMSDGAPFFVMEALLGGSVKSVLADPKRDLPWSVRWSWIRDTADGIAYLHSRKLCHRDLKSPNLVVSGKGVLKIADFGTAKLLSHLRRSDIETGNNVPAGTLLWQAPEVMAGQDGSYPSDIYSFAIVMYEIASRLVPFVDFEQMWDIRDAVLRGERPVPPPSCPPELASLMRECWAPEPHNRPSADVVAARLAVGSDHGTTV
eukprot:m.478004 g.478004  ORF g.478004 m.478004 type:complete len:982 (-) comp21009_c0_seq1:1461-4406(-)